MRVFRWLLVLPASATAFYVAIAATIAMRVLVARHFCPAANFDRSICSNRTLEVILKVIKHGRAALTVIAVAGAAVVVALLHKRSVLWVMLALLPLVAAWFGYAGTSGSLFVAALPGGVLAANLILRLLR